MKRAKQDELISPARLGTFSDSVLAVIITIMALELRPPHGGRLTDLIPLLPILLAYILSFTFIGTYWNNHHHLLRATKHITGSVMWANLLLLFWLSLIPGATVWVGQNPTSAWPAALYGVISLMASASYFVLSRLIIRANQAAPIAYVLGRDVKGILSEVFYVVGILLAFVNPLLSYALYVTVSIMWIVPDRRLTP